MIIDFPPRSAPVCGCGSVNLEPHSRDEYGTYLICDDCGDLRDDNGEPI